MKIYRIPERFPFSLAVIWLLILTGAGAAAKEAKLKPEEIAAKHLESIGTPEAIAAARSRAVSGKGQVTFRLPSVGQLSGKSTIVSEGRKEAIAMYFNSTEYMSEQLIFDGARVNVAQVRPGVKSNLSAFVYQNDVLLKEGLLGGAMTTAWALLDLPGRQAKLEYSGLKKIEGKEFHEMKYKAKKGAGDIQAYLYFDPATFRHVSSRYRLVVPAGMGRTPAESAGQRDSIYTIEETYDDFRTVDSLTIPHAYRLTFTVEGQDHTVLAQYAIVADQIVHNQPLDPKAFTVQ